MQNKQLKDLVEKLEKELKKEEKYRENYEKSGGEDTMYVDGVIAGIERCLRIVYGELE